ncbi:MAG: hypothetical protein WD072_03440 [Pirellulales bacterium]
MAKKPDEVSAKNSPLVQLEYNGHTFTFPRDQEDWATRAIIAATRKQYDQVVEYVLGREQWDLLMNVAAPAYRQFMEFLTLFAEAVERECSSE